MMLKYYNIRHSNQYFLKIYNAYLLTVFKNNYIKNITSSIILKISNYFYNQKNLYNHHFLYFYNLSIYIINHFRKINYVL